MNIQTKQQDKSSTTQTDTNESLQQQIDAQLNNERIFRDDKIQLTNLKTILQIVEQIDQSADTDKNNFIKIFEEHLKENKQSFLARYVLGMLAIRKTNKSNTFLFDLIVQYSKIAKWTIVDHIATQILDFDPNNRNALRAKVDSIERLKSKEDLKTVLARLVKIERRNPEVLQKYANAIIDDDAEQAIKIYKQAAEIHAILKNYVQLENLWELLVRKDHLDLGFFERIERIVVGNRDRLWMASQLIILLEPFRSTQNWPSVIHLLKKVLHYEPSSTRARSDLVRAYREIYANHSLLNEFLKVSELTNHKKSVEACIASFERNIVFDKDNFVFHRTRGVGKVIEMNKDFMIIDFAGNENQKMSLQMAINSLYPLERDHIWVSHYEDPQKIQDMFQNNIFQFFESLLKSYKGKILIPVLKREISKRFIDSKQWSKWWTRARTQLKKDPRFSFNPRKKDELLLRETPMTFADELSLRFQNQNHWAKKLEVTASIFKEKDVENALVGCIQFYRENLTSKDQVHKIQSFMLLEIIHREQPTFTQAVSSDNNIENCVQSATASDLIKAFTSTTVIDIKKELITWICNKRDDYPQIFKQTLFDTSVKAHRLLINQLTKTNNTATLVEFAETIFAKHRENPEVFLWLARQILMEDWQPVWIKKTKEEIFLLVLRLLPSLANIEKNSNKLKKQGIELVTGNFQTVTIDSLMQHTLLIDLCKKMKVDMLRRIISLFHEIPYMAKAHKENFEAMIDKMRSDYQTEAADEKKARLLAFLPKEGEILISEVAYKKRKEYIDRLINIEMPNNSREIGEAQERGDLRENSEYKAAMEKQSQLHNEIEKISAEIKKARIISKEDIQTDVITIGTKVYLTCNDEDVSYTILGPWDVDTDANIISYEARLARSLLGKKKEDQIIFDKEKTYKVTKIVSAFSNE